MNFTAIDFETANYKSSSACSLGLAVVENGVIIETKSFLFKPTPNYFENIHISIHGITPEKVKGKPKFSEIWKEIVPYLQNKTLVAHNASFDFSVLRSALKIYDIEFPTANYFCSMQLSKKSIEGLINYKLPTICKTFNIELNHHNAESDAKACALLSIELCKKHDVNSLSLLADILKFKNGNLFPSGYKPFSNVISKVHLQLDLDTETTDFDTEHPFYKKNVTFTGKLSAIPRKDAVKLLKRVGGEFKDSLTKETNYLVLGTYYFKQYGEGFKSDKLKKAEQLICNLQDLEIISEMDFFSMVNYENTSSEITLEQIEKHSNSFLNRNKYNELAGKNVYFSDELSIYNLKAFQMVGNCSGYGHDYDTDVIAESDYFVISTKTIELLKIGIKTSCIIDFEHIRNKALTRGLLSDTILLDETTFLKYMELR